MIIGILLLLGAWQGVMGNIDGSDICNQPSIGLCSSHLPEEMARFPKTEEDLNKVCPHLKQYIDCLKNYTDQCGFENIHISEFSEESFPVLKDLLNDACEEDSRLHGSIVRNLECFNEVIIGSGMETCLENTRKKMEKMRKHIQAIEVENNYDQDTYSPGLWMPLQCLGEAVMVSCIASEVSETCGSEAKETMLEVYSRSGSVEQYCPAYLEEKVSDLIKILELETEEEAAIREFIRTE